MVFGHRSKEALHGGGKETLVVAKLASRHWRGLLTLSPRANNPSEAEPRVLGTLAASFPLRADIPQSAGILYFTHYSNVPEVIALGGAGEVIGAVVFERAGPVPAAIPTQTVSVEGLGAVRLEVADNILTTHAENGPELRFNIMGAAHELANPLSNEYRPLRLNASAGDSRVSF
jgi:hypothetical protein